MQNAATCSRCLQPVPPKVSHCPGCRHPIHSVRLLPILIGAVGILALLFALLMMYRVVRSEDAAKQPVPYDDRTADQQELFPDPPPKSKEPAKPEKRPPLNDR